MLTADGELEDWVRDRYGEQMNEEGEKRTVIGLENRDEEGKVKEEEWIIEDEYTFREALISVLYTDAHIHPVPCVADTQHLACHIEQAVPPPSPPSVIVAPHPSLLAARSGFAQ